MTAHTEQSNFPKGSRLGPYEIASSIGAGGMGEVFRARDTRLNRDVAVKVLPKDFVADADRLRRFEQEAKTLAALNHPNVLTIHDAGVHEGAPYLVSELLEGKTLREEMNSGALPMRKATGYALQIAHGLAAAHAKGVVHRDLKPENIFVTEDGRVKILDFGLAKLKNPSPALRAPSPHPMGRGQGEGTADAVTTRRAAADINITEPGLVLGTPAYMSPEQVRGEPADHRADIFAFGTLLYEMLSGTRAFRRNTPFESMNAVLSEEPPDLNAKNANIPSGLVRIVERCLEKQPDSRFQSAKDLAFAIEAARDKGDPAPGELVWRRSRVVFGIATLVLLAVAVGWWFVQQSGRATKHTSSSPGTPSAAPTADQKSIAVLAFVNMSADRDNEYFSDGITEEILNALARTPGLRVAARTSAFSFKGKNESVQRIGEALKVGLVLEGSVRRAGKQLRITARLINVADEFLLWSDTFDRKAEDVFAIQTEVAQKVQEVLKVKLLASGSPKATLAGTDNLEAYDLYLRGRQFWNLRTEGDLHKARQFFQEAIGVDPRFALAYAGVADCYNALAYLNYLAPTDAFPKAKAAATKALDFDEQSPAAHAALGYYFMYHEFDFTRAGQEFQRAIELNPNYVTARHHYSIYLTAVGRLKQAREEIERAQKLDMLSVPVTTDMGFQLHYGGRQGEAIRQLQSALEMNPQFPQAHFWLGRIYTTLQQYDQALAEYEKVPALQTWQPMMAAKGYLYGVWGKPDEARKILADFEALRSQNRFVTSYGVALVHAGMGNQVEALKWLENALDEKSHWLIWLKLDPRWTSLRTEPRFQALVKKVGLDP